MYYEYLEKEDVSFMLSGGKGGALEKAAFNAGLERDVQLFKNRGGTIEREWTPHIRAWGSGPSGKNYFSVLVVEFQCWGDDWDINKFQEKKIWKGRLKKKYQCTEI